MTPAEVCRTVHAAGLSVRADGDALAVKPADRMTPEIRALLVANKPALLAFLHELELPTDWRTLARAYHAHHFGCPACIAAGQGRGLRCGVGAALWTPYQKAVLQ